jgi:predicted TIM-barrel fold metal-dependent hydrolase
MMRATQMTALIDIWNDEMSRARRGVRILLVSMVIAVPGLAAAQSDDEKPLLHDSHFHLTNYVQKGLEISDFLEIMGNEVGRVAIFGIPLQQAWAYSNTGDFAPVTYAQTDAPLYYYSFTDATIATAYLSLPEKHRARFDPMITGFNPSDMYAVDHIRRVLTTFPGVFTGIGEFTIHKEFVSAKTAGGPTSLLDPALDRILEFAAEAGLLVILHNDVDMPLPAPGQDPYPARQLGAILRRHPKTTVIWAHMGLGRVVSPVNDMGNIIDRALSDPEMAHLYIDLSWTATAKYLVASPEAIAVTASLINRHPDRFLFGTDDVAPPDQESYLQNYSLYAPLLSQLDDVTREKFLKGNYERLFDAARVKVRAWEKENVK